MNTLFLFTMGVFMSMNTFVFSQNLDVIRKNYEEAVSNKEVCDKMIDELELNGSTTVHLAYLGAYQTISANHISNPFGKLKAFKKGKMKIEEAIQKENENVEIRYIRLSIQKKAPSFLGYKSNIKEDELFLKTHLPKISSIQLKTKVETILEL